MFGHVLAFLALGPALLVFAFIAVAIWKNGQVQTLVFPSYLSWLAVRVLGGAGVIAAIWLWVWMLGYHFRTQELRSRFWLGFALVFLNWLAGIAYFFAVWRPRHVEAGG
jgi:hypothetical protein